MTRIDYEARIDQRLLMLLLVRRLLPLALEYNACRRAGVTTTSTSPDRAERERHVALDRVDSEDTAPR